MLDNRPLPGLLVLLFLCRFRRWCSMVPPPRTSAQPTLVLSPVLSPVLSLSLLVAPWLALALVLPLLLLLALLLSLTLLLLWIFSLSPALSLVLVTVTITTTVTITVLVTGTFIVPLQCGPHTGTRADLASSHHLSHWDPWAYHTPLWAQAAPLWDKDRMFRLSEGVRRAGQGSGRAVCATWWLSPSMPRTVQSLEL